MKDRKKSIALLLGCVTALLASGLAMAAPGVITNPVAPVGHDPWVIQHGDAYYYCYSHRGAIWINTSRVLQDAVQFKGKEVWRPVRGTAYSRELWAPELHWLQGRWYIYVAADDGQNQNHRMVVLESATNDAQGEYAFKGKISDSSDRWAIDGTVLEHEGTLYFIWSGWPGDENIQQDLYIARMANPWTINSARVRISTAEHDWERNGRPLINEGAQILKHEGRVFIIYSASGSWTDHYCLGQLTLTGTDPLDPEAWQKKPTSVFSSTATVFSPGHASFTRSPDGSEDWIIYHTARHAGARWNRQTRMQRFSWDSQGNPDFGDPISSGIEFPAPSE
jgi:GH43 family beta-xylosidase